MEYNRGQQIDIQKQAAMAKRCPTCGQIIKGGKSLPGQPRPTPEEPNYPRPYPDKPFPDKRPGELKDPEFNLPMPQLLPGQRPPMPGQRPPMPGQPEKMKTAVVVPNKCGPGWHHPSEADPSCRVGGKEQPVGQPIRRPGISKPTYPLPYPKKYRR